MHSKTSAPYFTPFLARCPQNPIALSAARRILWHFLAGCTIVLGLRYLIWRWTESYSLENPVFWAVILTAETLTFLCLLLFYFDIWDEQDSLPADPPQDRQALGLPGDGSKITVDIFVATYDEAPEIVAPTLDAALNLNIPPSIKFRLHVLDDGARASIHALALSKGAKYHARPDRAGFKAGNVREALIHSDGDFIAICDADTILRPSFLENTLGYFRDPKVSWVQTPHWFYDIPKGEMLGVFGRKRLNKSSRFARWFALGFGRRRFAADPFFSDSSLFFDVIQRRRNRHGGSFNCGAGSIYRREALLQVALDDADSKIPDPDPSLALVRQHLAEPLKFHVSEDILTSIAHHSRGYRSVLHPYVEAKMLSPQDLRSFLQQRTRYAVGTFDIFFHHNPILKAGMPLPIKLSYAATFASYLSVLWFPILFFAPAISLWTGWSPVSSYSWVFFSYLVPFLLLSEMALLVSCKGYDVHQGRVGQVALWPYHFWCFLTLLAKRNSGFSTTPKTPSQTRAGYLLWPHVVTLAIFATSLVFALLNLATGADDYTRTFLLVNTVWLCWNGSLTLRAYNNMNRGEKWRPLEMPSSGSNMKGHSSNV